MNFFTELKIALKPKNTLRNQDALLEHTTRAVYSIIGLSLLISTILVTILDLTSKQPVYWPIILMVTMVIGYSIAWIYIRNGNWRVARYFLPLIFLSSGAILTALPDLIPLAILQYVFSIILTSILFKTMWQWVTVIASTILLLTITEATKTQYGNILLASRPIIPIFFIALAVLQQISNNMITLTINNLVQETDFREKTQESAEQKEKILGAIAQSAQLLLDSPDCNNKINEVLSLLGKAANASHAYLFQNHINQNKISVTTQIYEWSAEGQTPEINNPEYQNVPLFEKNMKEWYELMITEQYFYEVTKTLAPEWANTPSRREIKTLLDVPVFVDNKWWGIIGFDDCVRESPWSQTEIDTMRIAAKILGSVMTRQKADEELRASEDKFETTFHETLVPMVIGKITDRIILDVNLAFTTLTGYSLEESINRTVTELNLWANTDEREMHRSIINSQGFLQEYKAHIRKKSGEVGVVLLLVSSIKINQDDCLLYTIYEITKLEQVLDELQNKNNELERFTYTVSHDFKAPLITIGGFAGLLEKDFKNGNEEKISHSIRRILDAVNKMERLLNELLELSRIGRMINEPQEVSFEEIAKEAVSLAHGRLSAPNLKVRIEAGLPVVKVDRVRIVEVIQNLLENAAKFMGEQANPEIVIGAKKEDGCWIFFVRDNGMGIDAVYHERVFGLFNKLDLNTEGTGVGLALVKRIIEFHGGKIWVDSDVGKGAVFYFTLAS